MSRHRNTARARYLTTITALTATAALLLAACSSGTSPTPDADPTPVSGGTLTYARPASVTSFDLHNEITSNNAFAIDKVFEPLVAFDSDGEIVDWLAAEHSVSDDGLTYTFTLRDGLLFSDGTPVTAEDVVFSLQRHLDVGGPLPISATVTSITAVDDLTTEIVLGEAYTPFLSELSSFANGILPADFGGVDEGTFFEAPVGTGPFVVADWDPAGDLTFDANPNYWDEGKPYIDELVYKLVADDSQALTQLQAGQVDAIEVVPPTNVAEIESNSDLAIETSGSWVVEQLFFNTTDEHFSDPAVRRALSMAIDRQGLTDATGFGTATVADALIPPTIRYSGSGKIDALEYDVDAAKDELASSSFPDGFETTLMIGGGDDQRAQEAQIIQDAAAKIGITVTIESLDLAAFRDRFFAYDFSFMINSGQSDSPDANVILSFQTDPDGFSKSYWTQYTDDRVTELLREGQVTPDGDDREAIYLEMQQILADDVPYLPLFYPEIVKASTASVHGLTVLPNDSVRFQDAWIDAE